MCPSRSRRSRRHRSCARAIAGTLILGALAPALALPPAPLDESLLLAVRVNGVDRDDAVRVLRAGARVFLSLVDWDAMHLRPAPAQGRHVDGQDYVPLDLPDLRWRIDDASQTLVIDAAATAFTGSTLRMDLSSNAPGVAPSPGAYANYDVEVQRGVAGTGVFAAMGK